MKHSVLELRKIFKTKLNSIDKLLSLANQEELLSEQRMDLLANVAVVLRALLCKDSQGIPLIESSCFQKELLFPLRNNMEPYNELREFLLVGCQVKDDLCCFNSSILDRNLIPASLLSFYSWINEVVVDLKLDGFPPLTREEVIKLIADKTGAHVDTKVHPFIELIESNNIMSVRFEIDGKEVNVNCRNLLSETIMSIADEVLYSFKFLHLPFLCSSSHSAFHLNIFNYSSEKQHKYKYSICLPTINNHNTNRYYECTITRYPITEYDLVIRGRVYRVTVVDAEDLLK